MSKYSITGYTLDKDYENPSDMLKMFKIFSGKNAGICYMKDSYYNSYVTDDEKAEKRFGVVASTGHHSIADHAKVTVLLEGVSKMLAMLLNSLQDYTTSEKSGRYTEMSGNSLKEKELYDKWRIILQDVIREKYSSMDNSQITKLAMENARYFLSVFTRSTVMSYTTSIRQWNYIYDWINDFESRCISNLDSLGEDGVTYFERELLKDLQDLRDFIESNLYIEELRDNKCRHFRFLSEFTKDISRGYVESIGDGYCINYNASFAYLAQAQRHRTLEYFMLFDGKSANGFYIPDIIKDKNNLVHEWLSDMESIKELIPQGMLIPIVECGDIYNFTLKCKERLCGRAQLEIMNNCEETLKIFNSHKDNFSKYSKELIDSMMIDGKVKTKGMLIGGCKESCYFGCSGSLGRDI